MDSDTKMQMVIKAEFWLCPEVIKNQKLSYSVAFFFPVAMGWSEETVDHREFYTIPELQGMWEN